MTTRVRVALALACAALAVVASHAYAQEARRQEAQLRQETLERYGGEVVSLVVASHQLEAGETVTEADVVLKEWVAELAPEGALVSLDEVVGSVLGSPVASGQVLTRIVLGSATASLDVPSGMVAVSLALTDKLGLVEGIEAGSRVFAYRVGSGGAELVSSAVKIVSVSVESGALSSSKDVTVAALPSDIPGLLEAAAEGTLRLVVPAGNVSAASAGVAAAPSVVEPESDADKNVGSDESQDSDPDYGRQTDEPQFEEGDGDGR